jgi:hypothetical protein
VKLTWLPEAPSSCAEEYCRRTNSLNARTGGVAPRNRVSSINCPVMSCGQVNGANRSNDNDYTGSIPLVNVRAWAS